MNVKKYRMKVWEKRVSKGIFGPKRDKTKTA
jgi:hypothetical protein